MIRQFKAANSLTRILIADDSGVNGSVALGQLRKLGYNADAVCNGFEVLQAFEKSAYDIVLMDCHMPEMDGFEAAAAIRQGEGTHGRTWIIAMTADAMTGDREQCLAAGMDDCVSKPVSTADLAAALERAPHSAAEAPETAAVDPQSLATLRELPGEQGENVLMELVQIFIAEAPGKLGSIRAAVARCDARAVAFAAHAFKSSCAQFGASRLHEICEILESSGRAGDLTPAPELLVSAESELQRVITALEPELQLQAA